MSDNGGPAHGPNDPTSFALQPPQQAHVPHPGNPYAQPTQAPPQPQPTQVVAEQQDPGAGRLVAGRYRLLSKLGHGGMGTVWRAKDETVDREVAVKEPRLPDHLPERERANAFERMRREARAAARLDHPNVVKIFDVVWWSGRSWIVMEYVGPRSLHTAIRADGPLPHREAAKIGLQMLIALRAAHSAGVLHRDVKPHNVLLGADGRVVLTDFGLATERPELTVEPNMGSPYFMAPERVAGGRSGAAADLWSLGATLYDVTEGRPPFGRPTATGALLAVATEEPDPPCRPGPLTPIIQDLLVKDPAARPSAAALEPRLRRIALGAVGVARPSSRVEAPANVGGGWRGRAAVPPPPTSRNRFDR
jgi:serine/threonine protein kinase